MIELKESIKIQRYSIEDLDDAIDVLENFHGRRYEQILITKGMIEVFYRD